MNSIFKIIYIFLLCVSYSNTTFTSFFKTNISNKYINQTKLIVFGDIGYYNERLYKMINISKSIMNNNDKIILLGDNFYYDGVEDIYDPLWNTYEYFFKNISKNNIYSVIGNHDYHKNPRSQINNIYWNTPSFYYKLELDNSADLFFIDTVQLYKEHCNITTSKIERVHNKDINIIENEQIEWLNWELMKSYHKKKIIFGHYPIVSNGFYEKLMDPFYNVLLPILIRYNVSAYVSGHEHNIQYVNKKIEYYNLNQFIIGSSSENRVNEYRNTNISHNDMFDNNSNYILIIYLNNDKIVFDFMNENKTITYKYTI